MGRFTDRVRWTIDQQFQVTLVLTYRTQQGRPFATSHPHLLATSWPLIVFYTVLTFGSRLGMDGACRDSLHLPPPFCLSPKLMFHTLRGLLSTGTCSRHMMLHVAVGRFGESQVGVLPHTAVGCQNGGLLLLIILYLQASPALSCASPYCATFNWCHLPRPSRVSADLQL